MTTRDSDFSDTPGGRGNSKLLEVGVTGSDDVSVCTWADGVACDIAGADFSWRELMCVRSGNSFAHNWFLVDLNTVKVSIRGAL